MIQIHLGFRSRLHNDERCSQLIEEEEKTNHFCDGWQKKVRIYFCQMIFFFDDSLFLLSDKRQQTFFAV